MIIKIIRILVLVCQLHPWLHNWKLTALLEKWFLILEDIQAHYDLTFTQGTCPCIKTMPRPLATLNVYMNIFNCKIMLIKEQQRVCIFTFTVNFTLSVSDMRPKTRADEEVSSPIRSAVIPKLIIISLAWFLIFTEYKEGAVIKTCKSASSSYTFYNFSRSKENT